MHPRDTPCSDQCSQCIFYVGLFDHDGVGEPREIHNFSNEFGYEELVHLFGDRFASFFSYLPLLL